MDNLSRFDRANGTGPQPGAVPEQPIQVAPQPSPQMFNTRAIVGPDGKSYVVFQIAGVCGQWVSFLSPEEASSVAAQLESAAAAARTGLLLPT